MIWRHLLISLGFFFTNLWLLNGQSRTLEVCIDSIITFRAADFACPGTSISEFRVSQPMLIKKFKTDSFQIQFNSTGLFDISALCSDGTQNTYKISVNDCSSAQCGGQNLVPNPGFEEYIDCPEKKYISGYIKGWNNLQLNSNQNPVVSDYFNLKCQITNGLYFEMPRDNPPRSGDGMLGAFQFKFQVYTVIWDTTGRLNKGYLYCKLEQALEIGKTYSLKFYTKFALSRQFRNGSIDRVGAVLSVQNPDQLFLYNGPNSSYIGPAPIVETKLGKNLTDSTFWVPITRTFVADKPYQYLILGHFSTLDDNTIKNFFAGSNAYNAYYLFDDVSLRQVDTPSILPSIIDRVCHPRDTGWVIKKLNCNFSQQIHRVYSLLPDTTQLYQFNCNTLDTGLFYTTLRTAEGCDSVLAIRKYNCDTAITKPKDNKLNVFIPNIFSPNQDGTNDRFSIFANVPKLKVYSFAIYSHLSQRVFLKENFDLTYDDFLGWDGYFPKGDPAPQGTYIWVMSYQDLEGNSQLKRGTVSLMR